MESNAQANEQRTFHKYDTSARASDVAHSRRYTESEHEFSVAFGATAFVVVVRNFTFTSTSRQKLQLH